MKKALVLAIFVSLVLISCNSFQSRERKDLTRGFIDPPMEARPRALWPWVDGNFDVKEITREMEEAKRMGLGGFDIWDVWHVVDEEHKISPGPAFMSDEYVKGICHAIREAKRLDLSLGLIVSSGWNAGGTWTLPQNQTMGIFHSDTLINGPGKLRLKLKFPVLPGPETGAMIPRNPDGKPVFYKSIAVIAIRQKNSTVLIPEKDLIDLSGLYKSDSLLNAELPAGNWDICWYVCTNTGEPMIASTPNSKGPMIDHFNPDAGEAHIRFFIDKLEKALEEPLKGSGLSYFYTDSYEVKGMLWTPAMTVEFENRKGYSLLPFLPALYGKVVADSNITSRFLFDYRQVLSDLIIESHYGKIREICETRGVGFVAEAAGPGMPIHNCPFESLKSSGALTFPRGEFWHLPSNSAFWNQRRSSGESDHFLNQLQVIKGVASASHIYGQKFVEAESFTGTHLWNEGPGDLKPTLDRALCEGLNRVIFHTWPHTPANSGVPGWVYAFGTIINENLVWWPMAKPFMDYIGRSSFLLQQGNFSADVLFYYGDEAPNFAPPKSIKPGLGPGYDYDYINTDVLMQKLFFENGFLKLPNGQKYRVLVMPDSPAVNPDVLEKIISLIKQGAIVTGPKPSVSQSLLNWKENDVRVKTLAEETWGDLDGKDKTSRQLGDGHLYWGMQLRDVLVKNGIGPDLDFSGNVPAEYIDFIHRSLSETQVYFIRNTLETKADGILRLRCGGERVEIWDPESGNISRVIDCNYDSGITELPVRLEGYSSLIVVISGKQPDGKVKNFDPAGYSFEEPPLKEIIFRDKWIIDFSADRKGPGKVTVDTIKWWNEFSEDGIRFFSGIAVYENTFSAPAELVSGKKTFELSFGDLAEVAEVYVNDEFTGTVWHSPFKINITKKIRKGENRVMIRVADTWANRLCGDARLPMEQRITNTNPVRLPNAWSYPMKDIPNKDYPLINSGIGGGIFINYY
jgi:hypothetical protein